VGNANSIDRGTSTGGRIDDTEVGSAGEIMGNASNEGHAGAKGQSCQREEGESNGYPSESINDKGRQTEPTLGGDADGPADRLDYAQLQVSCDNRTDELRLLGNGVVPATAERAFRTLLEELNT
jgi:hypothetical protein